MLSALDEYVILGIETTIPFLRDVMDHPGFISGDTTTDFIKKYFSRWGDQKRKKYQKEALIAAAVLSQKRGETGKTVKKEHSPWTTIGDWHIGKS